jgi:hypothetical protein
MDDNELVARLRRIASEVDPVPGWVTSAAQAALSTRDLDGELAVLLGDSAAGDDDVPVLHGSATGQAFEPVRNDAADAYRSRMLTFAGGGIQVDLEVSGHGDQLTVIGQVAGAAFEGCAIEQGSTGWRTLELDSLGRFLVHGVKGGPVRVRCQLAAGTRVTTTWVLV